MRIGIDIGGRHISCALVDDSGNIKNQVNKYINKKWELSEIANSIKEQIYEAIDNSNEITNIGIGVPGAVNSKTGFVSYSSNLPFRDINLKEYFEYILKREVTIENDANCAALGEFLFGDYKDKNDIILVTIGTGIGGGIIINKKIYSSQSGYAGEIGHHVIVANGRLCSCGNRGCLESYASMASLEKRANELKVFFPNSKLNSCIVNGKNIYDYAKKGDELSKEIVKEQLFYLGIGIANIINILQPEVVIISGAVSAQKEFLIKNLKPEINSNLYANNTYILDTSKLENKAGIIGAAFL
ncbi:MAG: ROK family protein [Clostridia bacterium]